MSFSHLATVGTLTYNGYEFDGSASVSVEVNFVKDEAQRTVVYSEHTITVRFFVNDSTDLDGDVLNIRARLSKQGQVLRFVGHGFGDDLIVNVSAGGLRDVKWGPVPEFLSWTPVGGTQTCEAVWQVKVCVPVCSTSPIHRTSGVMAMNYEVTFDIEKGFTTRTITGYLEIAQTRLLGTVPDVSDRYRHLVAPIVPVGFERRTTWEISLDKSRLNFTIIDQQHRTRNAYPIGVTKIEAEHEVGWRRAARGSMMLRNTLTCDIELAYAVAPALAWNIFGTLVRQRTDFALRNGRVALLDEVVAREELFGMGHSFTASWRLLVDVQNALNSGVNNNLFDFARTGLWQPVGTDWRLWRTSMSHIFDNRGVAGLTQLAANDAIVDLCSQNATIPWNGQNPPVNSPRSGQQPTFTNRRPPPNKSYLKYQMQVVPSSQRPVARQSSLQTPDQQSPNAIMQGTSPAVIGNAGQSTSDTIQIGGISRYAVSLTGQAMRAGYQIPRPALAMVGSQIPVEVDSAFVCEMADNWFGVPIFRAAWLISYYLPNAPGTVQPLPNLEN